MPPKTGSIPRQWRRFAEALLQDPNGARAARSIGITETNARFWAARVRGDPRFQAYYAERLAEAEAETRIQTHRLLEELAIVAFSNIDDYLVDDLGRVSAKDGAQPDAMRAVAAIEHRIRTGDLGVEHHVKIRLWDKVPAIVSGMKRLGMLVEKHEHSGTVAVEIDAPALRAQIAAKLERLIASTAATTTPAPDDTNGNSNGDTP